MRCFATPWPAHKRTECYLGPKDGAVRFWWVFRKGLTSRRRDVRIRAYHQRIEGFGRELSARLHTMTCGCQAVVRRIALEPNGKVVKTVSPWCYCRRMDEV